MELGIKQLVTVVLTLLVAVSLIGFAGQINTAVNTAFGTQIGSFTTAYNGLGNSTNG